MTSSEATADVFIYYAAEDEPWVEGYLIDALEAAGIDYSWEEAFRLGVPKIEEFDRAIAQSKRVLLVLTPAFVVDQFGQFTASLAAHYGLETGTWPVIPLILKPVELPPRLAQLRELDATDPDDWPNVIERLCQELGKPIPGEAAIPDCPYPGMVPFGEAQSENFYGRDAEVQEVVERLRLHPFLTVIGPSGSGKSSLVFAGVLPALRHNRTFGSGGWMVQSMRPGETPLATLEEVLGVDLSHAEERRHVQIPGTDAGRLLLIVDQFEESFTLQQNAELEPFYQALLDLADTPNVYILLTVRADFYPDLMSSPLWSQIQAHRLEITPLGEEQMREAIVRPAENVGVFVETALVERLVADAAEEPGVLPLVQETLVLLWNHVERRFLPLRAYEALVLPRSRYGGPERSGLQVAIARRADAALADLPPAGQAIARRLFLRLIQFGEGRADTRRQQPVAALRAAEDDPEQFERTLQHLTKHRLLTLSGQEEDKRDTDDRRVDIAHEALIGGWPTLQTWLSERREAEQTRRRLESKAEIYLESEKQGGLLDRYELLEAENWLASSDAGDLGTSEALRDLVQDSQRQRRRNLWIRIGVGSIIVALIVVALLINQFRQDELLRQERVAGETQQAFISQLEEAATSQAQAGVTIEARATAEAVQRNRAEAAATVAYENQLESERQARAVRKTLADQLATQAQVVLNEKPQQSQLLAVESIRATTDYGEPHSPIAEGILRDLLAAVRGQPLVGSSNGQLIENVGFSSDGRYAYTAGIDGTVWRWTVATAASDAEPIKSRPYEGAGSRTLNMLLGPNDRWLVTSNWDDNVYLWDLQQEDAESEPITLLGYNSMTSAMAIHPNGRWLVTGDENGVLRAWDLSRSDPASAPVDLEAHPGEVLAAVFSPDGEWLATSSAPEEDIAGQLRLWPLDAEGKPNEYTLLPGSAQDVNALVFTPDSRWLLTGGGRHWLFGTPHETETRLWDLSGRVAVTASIVLTGHVGSVQAIATSPDSRWAVTGGSQTAQLWDLEAPAPSRSAVALSGHDGAILSAAFSPDGRWLVTGSADRTARLWNLQDGGRPAERSIALTGHDAAVVDLYISPDSHWLLTGSQENALHLWDLQTADPSQNGVVLNGHDGDVIAAAFSPDSHWLVSGSRDGTARLWDISSRIVGPEPETLALPDGIQRVEDISPDQRWLAVLNRENQAALWNVEALNAGEDPLPLDHEGQITAVHFSPDGRYLATAAKTENGIKVWEMLESGGVQERLQLQRDYGTDIREMVFSPDNRWLAAIGNQLWLWDLAGTESPVEAAVLSDFQESVESVAISRDSRWLVAGKSDGTVTVWDLQMARFAQDPLVLTGHESSVEVVAIGPDNVTLFSGDAEGTVRIWERTSTSPEDPLAVLDTGELEVREIVVSPNGRWLAVGGWGPAALSVLLWDLQAAPLAQSEPMVLRSENTSLSDLLISGDSRWLVAAVGSEVAYPLATSARLWDLEAADPAASLVYLNGHRDWIWLAHFREDNQKLFTYSIDRTIRFWTLDLARIMAQSCRVAGRNFSHTEWTKFFPNSEYRRTCPDLPIHPSLIDAGREMAAAGNLEEAEAHFEKLLQIDPSLDLVPRQEVDQAYVQGLLDDGRARYNERAYAEARETFSQAIDYNGEHGYEPAYLPYFWRGRAFAQMGEWEEASQDLTQAIERQPDNEYLYEWQGYVHIQMGDAEQAIALLKRTLELRPNYDSAYYWLGRAYEMLDELEKAFQAYTNAAAYFYSPIEDIHEALARVVRSQARDYVAAGQYEAALDTLQQLADIPLPSTRPAQSELADLLVNHAYERAYDDAYDEALAAFRQALVYNPSLGYQPEVTLASLMVSNARSRLYDEEYEEALALFRRAKETNPDLELIPEAEVARYQAEQLASVGEIDAALAKFRQARELDPTLNLDPEARVAQLLIQRGYELVSQGEVEEALETYRRASELDPTLELVPEARTADSLLAQARNTILYDLDYTKALDQLAQARELDAQLTGERLGQLLSVYAEFCARLSFETEAMVTGCKEGVRLALASDSTAHNLFMCRRSGTEATAELLAPTCSRALALAEPLPAEGTVNGQLVAQEAVWSFAGQAGQRFTATLQEGDNLSYPTLTLYDSGGRYLVGRSGVTGSEGTSIERYRLDQTGDYFLTVSGSVSEGEVGTYTLQISTENAATETDQP